MSKQFWNEVSEAAREAPAMYFEPVNKVIRSLARTSTAADNGLKQWATKLNVSEQDLEAAIKAFGMHSVVVVAPQQPPSRGHDLSSASRPLGVRVASRS